VGSAFPPAPDALVENFQPFFCPFTIQLSLGRYIIDGVGSRSLACRQVVSPAASPLNISANASTHWPGHCFKMFLFIPSAFGSPTSSMVFAACRLRRRDPRSRPGATSMCRNCAIILAAWLPTRPANDYDKLFTGFLNSAENIFTLGYLLISDDLWKSMPFIC
jgi:hypothetical protein